MADDTGDLPIDYSGDWQYVDGVVAGTWRPEASRKVSTSDVTIRIKSVSITKNIARLLNIGVGLEPDQRIFTAWSAGLNGGVPQPGDFIKKASDWYMIERIETNAAGVQFAILCKKIKGSSP
jgi:hypothetical protein